MQMRIEHDTMGEIEVPNEALWGAANATKSTELQDWSRALTASNDPSNGFW